MPLTQFSACMIENGADSKLFEEMIRELLGRGLAVRFQARGASMSPAIRDGECVEVTPVIVSKLRKDDIVLAKSVHGFRLHRIVSANPARDEFITRGDCGQQDDPKITGAQILGMARSKDVRIGRNIVQARFKSMSGWALRSAARGQYLAGKLLHVRAGLGLFVVALLAFSAMVATAQVAVDSTTSGSGTLNGIAATIGVSHNTATTGTNRLMIVGISMNITNGPNASVTSVTWNGVGLILLGAHEDAASTRRIEMWYLLNPGTGTHNVIATVNTTSVNEGVVVGVTTFTGVDQTVPLGSFVSADGADGTFSELDVPSVVNGMILDTLAISGNRTVTIPGPQAVAWNLRTGATTNADVRGAASTRTGAPSVPISETFSGTTNWSYGAVSINPLTADIAVSTSVSAVALGQNSTYNITVKNNGPSAAPNVTLTDTYALTVISATPSAGSCSGVGTTTVSCTLPTPLASGASVQIAVVV